MTRFDTSRAIFGLILGTTAAFAQPAPAPNRPNPSAGSGQTPSINQLAAPTAPREFNFSAADANGDKRVSFIEYVDSVSGTPGANEPVNDQALQQFRLLDRDKDAFLSESEARGQRSDQPAASGPG
jgi:hypothetical protein